MRRKLKEKYRELKYERLGMPYFPVRETDCFITSWPRAGNTWMRYMVSAVLWPDEQLDLPEIDQRIPIVDNPKLRHYLPKLEAYPRRVFKSHEPYRPYYLKGKVALIIRNGRDAITSYHHFLGHMASYHMTLSEFLREACEGRLRRGSWHGTVRGWLEHKDNPNMIVVRYEDMLKDAAAQLRRVLDHFGIPCDEARLAIAAKASSVDRVNQGFQKWASQQDKSFSGGLGGGTGKGKERFTPEDEAYFQKHCGELMRELGYA
jgi:hypothetical protein